MPKSSHFLLLFIFTLTIATSLTTLANADQFIVVYEQYDTDDSFILEKGGNVTVNDFAYQTAINFNNDNVTGNQLTYWYPNMCKLVAPNTMRITDVVLPILGASPARYHDARALEIVTNNLASGTSLYQEYNDEFNMTEQHPDSPYLTHHINFMVDNWTDSIDVLFYSLNGSYISMHIGLKVPALYFYDSVLALTLPNSGSVATIPAQSTYVYARTLLYTYWNGTMRCDMSFYDSAGTSLSTFSRWAWVNFTQLYLVDTVQLTVRRTTDITPHHIYWVDSSHLMMLTNRLIAPKYVSMKTNEFTRQYFARYQSNEMFNYINESKGIQVGYSSQYAVYSQLSNGTDFYYKYQHKTTASAFQPDNSHVYPEQIEKMSGRMKLRTDFYIPSYAYFNISLTNHLCEIKWDAAVTNIGLYYDNVSVVNFTAPFLSIQATHSRNRFQIMILDDLYQHVYTYMLANDELLDIGLHGVFLGGFYVRTFTGYAQYLSSTYIYNKNYFLDIVNEVAFVENLVQSFTMWFPTLEYPIDEISWDGSNYFPYTIFIDQLNVSVVSNASISGYIQIGPELHFLSGGADSGYKVYDNTFVSYLWNPTIERMPNGGIFTFTVVLYNNVSDYIDFQYNISARYAIIYSTSAGIANYFNTGLDMLMPLVILTIFAYGMYSESRSKFLLGFGFLIGIVVLYLSDLISTGSLIMFIGLTIVMMMVFVKRERDKGVITND